MTHWEVNESEEKEEYVHEDLTILGQNISKNFMYFKNIIIDNIIYDRREVLR